MRIYPEVKISIGLIITFLLVVTGTGLAYTNSISAIEQGKSVKQNLELLAALESLLQVQKTSQRAALDYATTGNTKSLKKYEDIRETIGPNMQFIKKLASTDKRRYILLTNLETQVKALNNKLYSVVDKRKKAKANLDITKETRDKIDDRYDFIRGKVVFIEGEEKELLERRIALNERETEKLFNSFTMLGGLVTLFFLFLVWTLFKYVRTTRESQEAEKRISNTIFKHAPVGILVLEEDLSVLSVNPTIEEYIKTEKIVGNSVLNLIPGIPAEAIDYLDALVDKREVDKETKALEQVKVFEDKFFDLIFWPILDKDTLKGIIVVMVDVSYKVALNREKELLLNTFTHDLKNPLVGNQYLIKALAATSKELSTKEIEIIEQVNQGNEDLLLMVNNILNIAKLESTDKVIEKSEFKLETVLDEALEGLASFARAKNITLKKEFIDTDLKIKSDALFIKHLLTNLLTNAIKFSDNETTVKLKVSDLDNKVEIRVIDEGPGLSKSDKANLFSSVRQGEVGRRVPGGTGIGLYLCEQIVEALEGTIECESEQGKGATFIVTVPKVQVPAVKQ